MVHVLCANKCRTRRAITSTSPLQSLSEAPMSSAQERFAYLANTLIDAALGTGCVNKRGAAPKSSGTQRNRATLTLTGLRRTGSTHRGQHPEIYVSRSRSRTITAVSHFAPMRRDLIAMVPASLPRPDLLVFAVLILAQSESAGNFRIPRVVGWRFHRQTLSRKMA